MFLLKLIDSHRLPALDSVLTALFAALAVISRFRRKKTSDLLSKLKGYEE